MSLKHDNNDEALCGKNVILVELIFLFHDSRLFVDYQQIEKTITKHSSKSFIDLFDVVANGMSEYRKNDFIYVIHMNDDFHVQFFKSIIMKSKRFQSLLTLACNHILKMNINENHLIEQLNIIENNLNVYNIKFPAYCLCGNLNYMIYQNSNELTEPPWSKQIIDTRLLTNLIHEFFYVFLASYFNDFSYDTRTSYGIESLQSGYLFEKESFGTIKYKFWYDDTCCKMIFDEKTWLLSKMIVYLHIIC